MKKQKPRRLSSEEQELWDKVRQSTVPLHQRNRTAIFDAIQEISKPKVPEIPQIPRFRIGQSAGAAPTGLAKPYAPAPLQMDGKGFSKLKRGKLRPEAKLDLHGMTLDQAHPALIGFVLRSQAQGKRLVLVITGKGKGRAHDGPGPVRKGVLKHYVPNWLSNAPLKSVVLQTNEAHIRHGGTGAIYIYLRRQR